MNSYDGSAKDEGAITVFVCVAAVGLLMTAGLVVDGGAKVRAVQRADRLAAEAARAGGQAINVPAAITGADPVVDTKGAAKAVRRYLEAAGATGSMHVLHQGRALVVDVTLSTPTVFLGLMGINSMTVHGSSTVTLVRGVSGAGR